MELIDRYLVAVRALFPYYRQALMIVLFWVVVPMALASAVITAIYSPDSSRVWAKAIGAAWTGGVFSIGIVTAVFAVLETQRVRITALDDWEPGNLPEPHAGHAAARGESLASLIFSLAFLLLWTGLLPLPESSRRFAPEPIWSRVYLPILIVLASMVVTSFIDLIRPWRTMVFSVLRIAINIASATVAGIVLRAGHWVQVAGGGDGRSGQVDYWVNHGIQWSLFVVMAICLFDTLVEIWSTVKGRREAAI